MRSGTRSQELRWQIEDLEKQLAECRAVMNDVLEDRGLGRLFSFRCYELDPDSLDFVVTGELEETMNLPGVVRAPDLEAAAAIVFTYLRHRGVDPGDGNRVQVDIWAVAEGRGVLPWNPDYWTGVWNP